MGELPMKVLLVDDESYMTEYFKKLVDWKSYGFEEVLTASGGSIARDLIEQKKPEWFSGVFSVNSHMQMYSLRHCVLFLCTGFMLTHLHGFVNRKKARRTGIFSYSPHSADLSFIVTIICGLL